MSKQSYQVVLYVGKNIPSLEGVSVVNITPKAESMESIVDAIKSAELTAADLRAKTLLVVEEIGIELALKIYSMVIGFAGRRINISVDGQIIDAASLNHFGVISKDAGKPEETVEVVELERESFSFNEELDPVTVSKLRYAKKCILPATLTLKESLELFVRAAGYRVRNNGDHLPTMKISESNAANEEENYLDFNEYRKMGNELRRLVKTDDRGAVVERITPTERDILLEQAAKLPIEVALMYLGSYSDETGELWRCPRPERHRNGDLNPSMKINEEKVRCYRCDLEAIDAVRIIMDSLDVTPDEACKIIVSELI